MKNVISLTTALILIVLPFVLSAQTKYSSGGAAKMVVNGTSNIHDWKLEGAKGTCAGTFTLDAAGNLTALSGLSFTMPVTALKSEHGSQMDNNAYKAIGSDKYPNITFNSGSATVAKSGAGFTITAPGKLQISSGTKDVTLVATAKVNPDKSLTITGSYKLVTTDYNVKAISIMLGAIKTSANVSIDYNLVMKPQ
jgi:polyisoprenoid-binding protein YceI